MEVLCIITHEAVVILDMKEILECEDWNGKGPVRSPPVKRLIEFEEAGLPIAMGCLKFENTTLYMFGGENLTDDSYAYGGVSFGRGKLGYDVIALDLCDPNSKPTCVGKLNGPKILPIVFEFKSKIYIFSSVVYSCRDGLEVWDPVTRKASSLPPPSSEFSRIRGYFLTERGIVLTVDNYEGFFFNIDDQIWERTLSKPNEFDLRNVRDSVRLHGVLAPGYNHVYLQYVGEGILTVNLLEPPYYQTYDWYESYRALNVEYPIEDHLSVIADSKEQGLGLGLGPRYTCALVPCIDYEKEKMRIIIDVFRVDKKSSDSSKRPKLEGAIHVPREEVVSFTSLKKQVYEFNFHKRRGERILPFVRHAFIWSLPQVSGTSREG